jgi:ATP-binding cassette, subfamily B, multidrug efflux pump
MIVGAILILLWIEARLALVMLVFLPIVIAVLAFYQRNGAPLYRGVLARFDGLNQVLQENMAGVRVVQAFVRSDYENARFDRENRALQQAATAAQRSAALLNPALLLVVNRGSPAHCGWAATWSSTGRSSWARCSSSSTTWWR